MWMQTPWQSAMTTSDGVPNAEVMESIALNSLLPLVFRGMEDSEKIRRSEVWCVGSLTLARGCKVCIQAESGSGKSSLLSFIYGQRHDYSGRILFDGSDIRSLPVAQWCLLRTRSLALLPQEMCLFPELTVLENINIKNSLTRHKTPKAIGALLERLGIADKQHVPAGKLSIGQQQRVALVRTVCQPFDFIFLDEPVSHLDAANNQTVASIIEEEAAAQGAGIVATSVGNHLLLSNPQFIAL